MTAFGITRSQVVGPDWLDTEHYDIDASLPRSTTAEQFQSMLQNLLIERFQMIAHSETKDRKSYVLTAQARSSNLRVTPGGPRTPHGKPTLMENGWYELVATGTSMRRLVEILTSQLGEPVLDRTGLDGSYDFDLKWVPEKRHVTQTQVETGLVLTDETGPTLLVALEKQLGLKLVIGREAVRLIIIDRMEKTPTAN